MRMLSVILSYTPPFDLKCDCFLYPPSRFEMFYRMSFLLEMSGQTAKEVSPNLMDTFGILMIKAKNPKNGGDSYDITERRGC